MSFPLLRRKERVEAVKVRVDADLQLPSRCCSRQRGTSLRGQRASTDDQNASRMEQLVSGECRSRSVEDDVVMREHQGQKWMLSSDSGSGTTGGTG